MKMEVLSQLLSNHIEMHPARRSLFVGMVFAMLQVGKSTLKGLAEGITGTSSKDSKIRKIQVFFKEQVIDWISAGLVIVMLLGISDKVKIILDRTNWKYGKSNINYFVASIEFFGTAIPICWILLDKRGNSSTAERIQLMEMVFKIISSDRIECLLADREFIGDEWFYWLDSKQIPFVIRIKENFVVYDAESSNSSIPLALLFASLKKNKIRTLQVNMWGKMRKISAKRLDDGSLLILTTNLLLSGEALCNLYKQRWAIETIFKALKTKGFNIEDSHMVNLEKLAKLFFVATLAAIIAIKSGLIRHQKKPIIVKNHRRSLFSFFSYGLDYLRFNLFKHTSQCLDRFLKKVFQLNLFYQLC